MAGKGAFGKARRIEGQVPEGVDQFGVTAGGDGQDELQLAPALISQRAQLPDVLQAQEAAVRHQDEALNRKAGEHLLQHALQSPCLADIAGMNGVHERQPLGGLHHAEDELPGNAALVLAHAESANVLLDRRLAMDPHGRQVVEDDGKLLIDQWPDLAGQSLLDNLRMVRQRIHGAQKLLVSDGCRHGRHGCRFQPAQAAQPAGRIAQAVERHRPDQRLGVEFPARGTQRPLQGRVEVKILPDLVQGEDIAETAPRLLNDLRGGVFGAPNGPVEPVDQRVQLVRSKLVEAPEVGNDARSNLSVVIAERLDQLQVLASAGLGDARMHCVASLPLPKSFDQDRKRSLRVTTRVEKFDPPTIPNSLK